MKKKTNKSFGLPIRGLSAVAFALLAPSAQAVDAYAYTLTVGKNTNDNTGRPLVAPDFITITAALNKIPNVYSNGKCSARYLVKVLPGVYNERVRMKPCVDIEGSGELATKITAPGGINPDGNASPTLNGASEAELRFLTVANTGGNNTPAVAIWNVGTAPRLTHVTAIASGSVLQNTGVFNANKASPIMTNVTATATTSGGTAYNVGVWNSGSSPMMENVTATATTSGGTAYNVGVWNSASSPKMENVTATATASGSTSWNIGVWNNSDSSSIMRNVTATATASDNTEWSIGVSIGTASLMMDNVTATASGGTSSIGVLNMSASLDISPTILRSTLRGTKYSLQSNGGTVRVGASQLDGPVVGSTTCAVSFNGDFAPLNANCQ
jgi:hypothetical protein